MVPRHEKHGLPLSEWNVVFISVSPCEAVRFYWLKPGILSEPGLEPMSVRSGEDGERLLRGEDGDFQRFAARHQASEFAVAILERAAVRFGDDRGAADAMG